MRCLALAAALVAVSFPISAQQTSVPAAGSPLARSVAVGQPIQVGDLPPAPVVQDWRPRVIVVHGHDHSHDDRGSFGAFALGTHDLGFGFGFGFGGGFGFGAGPHVNTAGLHRR